MAMKSSDCTTDASAYPANDIVVLVLKRDTVHNSSSCPCAKLDVLYKLTFRRTHLDKCSDLQHWIRFVLMPAQCSKNLFKGQHVYNSIYFSV
jgi:hypothetical protein